MVHNGDGPKANGAPGLGFLRWRGMLEVEDKATRRTVAGMLALACITLAFTQWGFVGMQFADGSITYLVTLIVPVALACLTLGTLPGSAMGLFSGTVLCLHAQLMPLDFYEIAYVTPGASILGMALFGLVLGSMLSFALNGRFSGWRRIAFVVLACLVASAVFSARFAMGTAVTELSKLMSEVTHTQEATQLAELREKAIEAMNRSRRVEFQVLGHMFLTGAFCVSVLAFVEWRMSKAGEEGLRMVFGEHLFVVVLMAFMIVVTTAYGAVTATERAESQSYMLSEVDYLLHHMKTSQGPHAAELLLTDLEEDVDGLVIITSSGRFVGSNAKRLESKQGMAMSELFGNDVSKAAQRSTQNGTLERIVYLAPSSYSNLVNVSLSGGEDEADPLMSWQIGYLTAKTDEGLEVTLIRPASMVFDMRSDVVFWLTLATLVLLASVFALTARLLDRLVARRIDKTNAVLGRITDGDLDARVIPAGTREFWDLSAGINVTVDALQGWIAEAKNRMNSELAAARAIQKAALPNEFPPYPDIARFDLYASMHAAREVGGDFYDFFLLGDSGPDAGRLAFVIADVSGKGIPAALFMMKAKAQIRQCLEVGMGVGEAMDAANRQLCDGNEEDMFVTVWAGVLDYATGHVEYVNAGHNYPLLRHEGAWRWLTDQSGMPMGLFEDLPYEVFSLECEPGDLFLLYTDGVTEAFSATNEQYGDARLERVANENTSLGPRDLIGHVRKSVAAHAQGTEQSDDITMLALEISPSV